MATTVTRYVCGWVWWVWGMLRAGGGDWWTVWRLEWPRCCR